jgi:drug/metabolite transporter (DMT)-like permease
MSTSVRSFRILAVICVVAEMLLATISNVLLRLAAGDLSPETTLFLRLVLTSALLAPFLMTSPSSRHSTTMVLTKPKRLGRYVACGVVSYLASIAWLYALLQLPIAVATSLFFTTALFMTLLSRWWLSEPFTIRNGVALGVGLVGVLIVLNPSLNGVQTMGVIAALTAAVLAALGKLQLKTLSGPEPPALSAFLRLAPVIPFAAISAVATWSLPSPSTAAFIGIAAILLALAHAAIAKGYVLFSLSQAAVLEYLRLLFATVAGILVFAEPIGAMTLVGGAVILAAALFGAGKRTTTASPQPPATEPERHAP